jgi:hypothetical protein
MNFVVALNGLVKENSESLQAAIQNPRKQNSAMFFLFGLSLTNLNFNTE